MALSQVIRAYPGRTDPDRGKAEFRSARRNLSDAWLAVKGVQRRVRDTYRGGDCIFTSVATMVGIEANWLRAMTLAYARTHPDLLVPANVPGMTDMLLCVICWCINLHSLALIAH